MIQIVDRIECENLQRSIVRPEALKKVVLVQDAGTPDHLFALLMVDPARAVLVEQGPMSLSATGGSGMLKLQSFRNQIYKAGVSAQELKFCAPGTYGQHLAAGEQQFDPAWFVPPTLPELAARFLVWRSGKASW